MYPAVTYAVAVFLAVVAVVALLALKLPRLEVIARTAMKVAHAATAVVVGVDALMLLRGHEVENMVTHVGYMIAAVGLPLILLNQRAEVDEKGKMIRDGEGNQVMAPPPHLAVVAVCALTMVVLIVRLQMTL